MDTEEVQLAASRKRGGLKAAILAACALIIIVVGICAYLWWTDDFIVHRIPGFQVLSDGRILVTDGGGSDWSDRGSKVFIVDRRGRVSWRYDEGLRFAHSAIELADGDVLIPDANNDRLVEVSEDRRVVWASDSWGGGTGALADGSHLRYPNHVVELEDGWFLVSDRLNSRVIEVNRRGEIRWSFAGASKQHAPIRLPDGNTLIADSDGNRIVEVDRGGRIVWQFAKGLRWPRYAQRQASGNTLITDSNNNRIVEVTPAGEIVFEYGKGVLNTPYQAEELPSGRILISDAQHGRLIEIDRQKRITWKFERKQALKRRLAMGRALANGGAEAAGAVGAPDGWTRCDLLAGGRGRWWRDVDVCHSGAASLAIEEIGASDKNKWWGQILRTKGGEKVKVSAYIKTEGVERGVGVSLNFLDALGGVVGGASSAATKGDGDWKQVTLVAPTPKNAVAVALALSLIGPGRAYWDDVTADFE